MRNLDLEAHGRKTAAEAWVVTVAIFSDLNSGGEMPVVTCEGCGWESE